MENDEVPDSKDLGAFYTDSQVADFLVWWAVRSADDCVIDPSFGAGVFLRATCEQLNSLGADASSRVFGVEIDADVHRTISDKLYDEFGLRRENLVLADLFEYNPPGHTRFTVAVGNPPFIRYHRFSGTARSRALKRAKAAGVQINELTSSWAPFLIASAELLADGGRLAMVLPMEICHAQYARPVLAYLARAFSSCTFLTFRKRLFPNLSQDTLLLLAEGKGIDCDGRFYVRDLANSGALTRLRRQQTRLLKRTAELHTDSISSGKRRVIEHLIPGKARDLYREIQQLPSVARLQELADIGIGYVTGANDYFHVAPETATRLKIPPSFLKQSVRRGRALNGLRFTNDDWQKLLKEGNASLFLHLKPTDRLTKTLRDYVSQGESAGIQNGFKCRNRNPWYCVPNVYLPDAFLSYMSGAMPRLVANDAGVYAPNSLHIVRLRNRNLLAPGALAAVWQTSLTRLSVELEGHAMGGGLLKLEPSEADSVLVANPTAISYSDELLKQLDTLCRNGRERDAIAIADKQFLREKVGLSASDCALLREAAGALFQRRYSR